MELKRFQLAKNGAGIPAIRDRRDGRLVCIIFRDKDRPEAAEHIMRICCDALNAENERYARSHKESGES